MTGRARAARVSFLPDETRRAREPRATCGQSRCDGRIGRTATKSHWVTCWKREIRQLSALFAMRGSAWHRGHMMRNTKRDEPECNSCATENGERVRSGDAEGAPRGPLVPPVVWGAAAFGAQIALSRRAPVSPAGAFVSDSSCGSLHVAPCGLGQAVPQAESDDRPDAPAPDAGS